jgi:long-subunit fatty acid transport protein
MGTPSATASPSSRALRAGIGSADLAQVSIVTSGVEITSEFHDRDSRSAFGQRLGSSGGDAGDWNFVPSAYLAAPWGERFALGIGVMHLSASLQQGLGERVSVLADVAWTGWSSIQELRVVRDSGATASLTPERWHDIWRYSLPADRGRRSSQHPTRLSVLSRKSNVNVAWIH